MYDLIIIGAGAAGLMAAGVASREGRKVLVVEKMEKGARKVRITGKGRCNITNTRPAAEFLEKIRGGREFFAIPFSKFDNNDLLDFFRSEGLRLNVERGGRVFPASDKAWDVADALVDWALEGGAEIVYHTRVTELVVFGGKVRGAKILTRKGFPRTVEASSLLIATGGASYPATGSTGDGYMLAGEAGHRIVEIRPSLVPLETGSEFAVAVRGLKLKNVEARLIVDNQTVRAEFGELEFTTRGIEGAVILKISRDAVDALTEGRKVSVWLDIKPALEHEVILGRIEREVASLGEYGRLAELLRRLMPAPMVAPFADTLRMRTDTPLIHLGPGDHDAIAGKLKNIRIDISDYRPFTEAVVTAGGVDTSEVDPETMQSKLVGGLYFAGEILDIDADTGGYNLQIAFTTGWVAGKLSGREVRPAQPTRVTSLESSTDTSSLPDSENNIRQGIDKYIKGGKPYGNEKLRDIPDYYGTRPPKATRRSGDNEAAAKSATTIRAPLGKGLKSSTKGTKKPADFKTGQDRNAKINKPSGPGTKARNERSAEKRKPLEGKWSERDKPSENKNGSAPGKPAPSGHQSPRLRGRKPRNN